MENCSKPTFYAVVVIAFVISGRGLAAAVEVTVARSQRGAVVRVDGKMFAEYLTNYKHQPAVWPIIGPTDKPMTRSFPIGPLLESERDDHPHHHSLWFAHEDVNGHNFWIEPQQGLSREQANVIKHLEFVRVDSDGDEAVLVTRNQWLAGVDGVVCEDQRTLVFGAADDARWIDFSIKILATNGPVTFGDIKDGTFSTRVAGPLKVDSGGRLVNSVGQTDAEAWGMPAEWIDNYGPLDGETVGIAMFSHPANFRHPCRWHVRTYGLLCANPFGERQFPPANIRQSGRTIEAGDALTLRYRVLLHKGDTEQAQVAEVYREFAMGCRATESHATDANATGSAGFGSAGFGSAGFGSAGFGSAGTGSDASRSAAAGWGDAAAANFLFADDFEHGLDGWATTDANSTQRGWELRSTVDAPVQRFLRVTGNSNYQPPHRSPLSVALVKDVVVGSFELTARVQNTNSQAGGHRDLCFFWGFQDPAHFYYVHLGAQPDPHSSQIFIVDGAPRQMITENKSPGIPWTDGWHDVKVVYQRETGLMQVYFDDLTVPVLIAKDTTFDWGRVGLGTFDDHGNFDKVRLRGEAIRPIPATAKLP